MFGADALKTILLVTEECTLKCGIEKAGLPRVEQCTQKLTVEMSGYLTSSRVMSKMRVEKALMAPAGREP